MGRGQREACVGTWDLGTRDEGLEDIMIKYGTRGRVRLGRGQVEGKYDISFFVKMCYLLVNIRFHLPKPHWTPYVHAKYFFMIGVSALTIVIRVRVDFHSRVIFPCVRA